MNHPSPLIKSDSCLIEKHACGDKKWLILRARKFKPFVTDVARLPFGPTPETSENKKNVTFYGDLSFSVAQGVDCI